MSKERRKHLRWKQDERVYCYVDGDRTDLHSEDLSGGGMFLVTELSIPLEAQVALVFSAQYKAEGQPIFLLAKVVRCQKEPIAGVGLRWERAVTDGDSEQLMVFLRARLRLISPSVKVKILDPETKQSQAWYQFTAATRSVGPPQPRAAARRSSFSAHKRGKLPAPKPPTSKQRPPDKDAPLDIDASLVFQGKAESVQVYSLGLEAMRITAEFMCPAEGTAVKVRLSFKEKWGTTDVSCDCMVTRTQFVEDQCFSHLELQILEVDEGWQQGIFQELVESFD